MTVDSRTTTSGLSDTLQGPAGALLLLLLVVGCYASTATFGYIWDDDTYVQNNMNLRDVAGLSRMWTHIGATPQYYPVTFTSLWAEYQLFGLNPAISHVLNLLLHAASVVMLWKVLQGLRVPGAWLAAAIFAVHPINVESVAWISERKNTLSLAFGMAALLVYLRYAGLIPKPVVVKPIKKSDDDEDDEGGVDLSLPDDPKRLYGLFLILFICALLSKTTLAVLPGVILVIAWWKRGRLGKIDIIPMLAPIALGLAAGLLTSWIEQNEFIVGATGRPWEHGLLDRLALAGQVSWFYVGKLILPHPFVWGLPDSMKMGSPPWFVISVPTWVQAILPASLSFNYPKWQLNASIATQWLGTAGALIVVVMLWVKRGCIGRGALACVFIYLGCLIPAMGLANVYPMRFSWVADHFAYVASIGLIVLFAAGVTTFFARVTIAPIVAALLLILLSVVTIAYSQSFANIKTLWSSTLIRNEHSWIAAASLGGYLRTEADRLLIEELPLAPDKEVYRQGLVRMYQDAGRWFERAKKLNPDSHEVPFQQALLAMRSGQADEALKLAMQSESVAAEQGVKQFIYPQLLIASLSVQRGDLQSARQIYLDLQSLESKMGDKMPATFADARVSLSNLDRKRLSGPITPNLSETDSKIVGEMIENLTVATDIAPQRPAPKLELARLMIDLGRTDQAYELAAQVLSLDKNDADAKLVVAEGLIKDGNAQLAAAQLSNLILTHPNHLAARMKFAQMLIELKRADDAIRELDALIKIDPKNEDAIKLLSQLKGTTTQPTTSRG